MKRLILAVTAIATILTTNGGEGESRGPRTRRMSRPSGGLVEKAYEGPVLRVVDETGAALPSGALAASVEAVRLRSRLPLVLAGGVSGASRTHTSGDLASQGELRSGDIRPTESPDLNDKASANRTPWWRLAAEAAREPGVAAAVLVIDDAAYPFLMDSPDGRWAVLNVAAVKGDASRLGARLTKLTWNAAARAVGAGGCGDAFSVFAPFATVAELDRLASDPGPMGHNALIDAARARGLKFVTLATYRTACQQGWAPPPTNDVQKAIWKEVHAIPDRPMTIEFDPKKDK